MPSPSGAIAATIVQSTPIPTRTWTDMDAAPRRQATGQERFRPPQFPGMKRRNLLLAILCLTTSSMILCLTFIDHESAAIGEGLALRSMTGEEPHDLRPDVRLEAPSAHVPAGAEAPAMADRSVVEAPEVARLQRHDFELPGRGHATVWSADEKRAVSNLEEIMRNLPESKTFGPLVRGEVK